MFEIIPLLEVNESCQWCEPQKCFTASIWWGDCLLVFYTTHADRLEPTALNDTACKVLKEITRALKPGHDEIIDPAEMGRRIGNCNTLECHWADFVPAVAIAYGSRCIIPVESEAVA